MIGATQFGLATEKLTALVPPGRIFAGVNDLVITGGATTVTLAVPAVGLLPPLVEPTVTELG